MTTRAKSAGEPFVRVPLSLLADPGLSLTDAVVFSIIQDHLGRNKTAWPSVGRVCRLSGVHRATGIRSIRRLERQGRLLVDRSAPGRVNHYSVKGNPSQDATGRKMLPVAGSDGGVAECDGSGRDGGSKLRPEPIEPTQLTKPRGKRRQKTAAHPDHQRFIDWWCELYLETYAVAYLFEAARDGKLVSSMLKAGGDNGDALGTLQQAARNMLADPWGRDHATIGTLKAQLNNWRKPAAKRTRGGKQTPAPSRSGESYAGMTRRFSNDDR